MSRVGVQIKGLDKVIFGLKNRKIRGNPIVNSHVSYSAPYSVFVHEDLQKNHPVGQAKFLETAARNNYQVITTYVHQSIKGGQSLQQALHGAGYIVLMASNALCPRDTGFLIASGRVDVK